MATADKLFVGSIPDIYDRYMVPLLFEPYAHDLAARVAAHAPKSLLETAAGTGVVTRALSPRLEAGATYVATDLNAPMLELAQSRHLGNARIEWRRVDAQQLPFGEGTFDVVCCQFGAMFFPDRVLAFREARRILKDNGHFIFNVWDSIEHNEFANTTTEVLANLFPQNPPSFLARTPHGYSDEQLIRRDLASAGFSRVTITPVSEFSRAPSSRHPALGYCHGTPLRHEIEAQGPSALSVATERVSDVIASRWGTSIVTAKMRALVIEASV